MGRRLAGALAALVLVGSAQLASAAPETLPLSPKATATARAGRVDPPPRTLTIVAGGDVLTEQRVRLSAQEFGRTAGRRFDFFPLFAPVSHLIGSADLAICNAELPIGRPGDAYGNVGRSSFGGNRLIAPFELAEALGRSGFDRCSTATNHAFDGGVDGIASTIEALDAHGIATSGTARSEREAGVDVFDVDGVRVAHLSTTRGLNDPIPSPSWRIDAAPSADEVIADARRARDLGADIVVLSLHVTVELRRQPTESDRRFVQAIAASDAVDAVFTHGPHVIQPFEMVGSTAVWWSLGNFVSEMGPAIPGRYSSPRTADGLLARIEFTPNDDGAWTMRASSLAICNDLVDRTVRHAATELGRRSHDDRIDGELRACLARTREVVPDAF